MKTTQPSIVSGRVVGHALQAFESKTQQVSPISKRVIDAHIAGMLLIQVKGGVKHVPIPTSEVCLVMTDPQSTNPANVGGLFVSMLTKHPLGSKRNIAVYSHKRGNGRTKYHYELRDAAVPRVTTASPLPQQPQKPVPQKLQQPVPHKPVPQKLQKPVPKENPIINTVDLHATLAELVAKP